MLLGLLKMVKFLSPKLMMTKTEVLVVLLQSSIQLVRKTSLLSGTVSKPALKLTLLN